MESKLYKYRIKEITNGDNSLVYILQRRFTLIGSFNYYRYLIDDNSKFPFILLTLITLYTWILIHEDVEVFNNIQWDFHGLETCKINLIRNIESDNEELKSKKELKLKSKIIKTRIIK